MPEEKKEELAKVLVELVREFDAVHFGELEEDAAYAFLGILIVANQLKETL